MAYKALYRKWRPEVFEEVIGQRQVIRTLKNQITSDSISHAYLFSGIRGTGKTSTAKIFARAINCLNPTAGDPCNVCEVCRGILSEQMMDVLEIDAASNNGVDHIREIRENVKYPPVKSRYKVYIIDEVHMLSTGAFNALLKTLEEPPDYVVFILATTELHKIPATVLSRCLRFTFKPLSLEEIRQRLLTICRSLGVDYEEAAVTTIALNGEGALRDSLSILDQCLAYHPGELHYHQVVEVLGSINESLLFQLAGHVSRGEALETLRLVQSLYLEGKDLQQLVTDTMKHYRWLLMASLNATVEGWETLPEATREQYHEQSRTYQTGDLTAIIRQLAETEYLMKRSAQPQLMLENSLITLCHEMKAGSFSINSAGHSEKKQAVSQGSSLGESTSRAVQQEYSQLDQRISRIEDFLSRLKQKKAAGGSASPPPPAASQKTQETQGSSGTPVAVPDNQPAAEYAAESVVLKESAASFSESAASSAPGSPLESAETASFSVDAPLPEVAEPAETIAAAEKTEAPASCGTGPAAPLTLDMIRQLWPHVLDQMRADKKVSIQAMAREAQLAQLSGCELTLAFLPEQTILCERLAREDIKEYLATLIQQKTGRRLRLKLEVKEAKSSKASSEQVVEKLKQVVPEALVEVVEDDEDLS